MENDNFFGRNIKLSEGGIRDIEFFAQTRQIIAGGRDRYLTFIKNMFSLSWT